MRSVGAIILAAGQSSRFGKPKPLLPWAGESLVRRAVRAATEAGCARVVVVVGAAGEEIARELRETNAEIVRNPDAPRGMGTSIRCGVQHLCASPEQLDAAVLLACDQPLVEAQVIAALIARWQESGRVIVASRYADTLGIPALFQRSGFDALLNLPDASGAKALLESTVTAEIAFEAGAIDIDTPADYANAVKFKP
ncbi:MAG TPA: nucleotidyltransferase family protein [Chthoniobacterales bacterium]|nr:nucleotidyltransferase family protein [Chthoniobacterales bacterium]